MALTPQNDYLLKWKVLANEPEFVEVRKKWWHLSKTLQVKNKSVVKSFQVHLSPSVGLRLLELWEANGLERHMLCQIMAVSGGGMTPWDVHIEEVNYDWGQSVQISRAELGIVP